MRIFGLEIGRAKALSPPASHRGWWSILEAATGNWQRNIEVRAESVMAYHAVFACMSLISGDISSLRLKLMREQGGIWTEVKSPAFSPVLRRPNGYQTRNQFWESWMLSKLSRGNTYVLKQRDNRGVVNGLHVLDPARVMPLIADDGSIFYDLHADSLAGIQEGVVVPAREIIHDRYNCMFHPLVGLSPIYANGLAAMQGLNIQNNSATFFGNASIPGGLLMAPGAISDETAKRLKEHWEANYSGKNSGKIAVLGDNLKFEPMSMKAVDAQLLEQLKWTAEIVCGTFHVPPYKIGVGQMPTSGNVQALNLQYYTDALRKLIEDAEACLDEGLGTGETLGVEFEVNDLLRMDSQTQMEVLERAKSVMTLDERRKKLDLQPITGGSTVYLQQQDHSIEAIAARDKLLIEEASVPAPVPAPQAEPTQAEQRAFMAETLLSMRKALEAA